MSGECREPDSSALIERLLCRYTEPVGVIDVRHTQAHYERLAGWMEARYALLAALAARHELALDDESDAAAIATPGDIASHPSGQWAVAPGAPPPVASRPSTETHPAGPPQPRVAPMASEPEGDDGRAMPNRAPLFRLVRAPGAEYKPIRIEGGAESSVSHEPLVEKAADEVRGGVPSSARPAATFTAASPESPEPPESTPTHPVRHVRPAPPSAMALSHPGSIPSPERTSDTPHPPLQSRSANGAYGDAEEAKHEGHGETSARLDPLMFPPSIRASARRDLPPGAGRSDEPDGPGARFAETERTGGDFLHAAPIPAPPGLLVPAPRVPTPRVPAPRVPTDLPAFPLARMPAKRVDRALEGEALPIEGHMRPPPRALYTKSSSSGITEPPPVVQPAVPSPEQRRLHLSKGEWAELVERLSRSIWHRLAVDLDRRGIRSWR